MLKTAQYLQVGGIGGREPLASGVNGGQTARVGGLVVGDRELHQGAHDLARVSICGKCHDYLPSLILLICSSLRFRALKTFSSASVKPLASPSVLLGGLPARVWSIGPGTSFGVLAA